MNWFLLSSAAQNILISHRVCLLSGRYSADDVINTVFLCIVWNCPPAIFPCSKLTIAILPLLSYASTVCFTLKFSRIWILTDDLKSTENGKKTEPFRKTLVRYYKISKTIGSYNYFNRENLYNKILK